MSQPKTRSHVVALNGALTLRTVEAEHERLRAALDHHADVVIDCSGLVDVDLSGLQLLLVALRGARDGGRSLSLAQPANGVLRDALVRAGFLPLSPDPASEEQSFWLKGAVLQ